MPRILDRLVSQLKNKGYNQKKSYAIATSKLQKAGHLKKGTNTATLKGKLAGAKTPAQRAIQRAVKLSGKSPKAYVYNPKTNRATLKK
tara:strand:+ start:1702 stop:1965 length:264 start_codon:yes stop_codon:yes gene_type:complete